ncbi:MAG: hypothetical protein QXO40_05515 [Candidatus Aenigmatarchaeota archaeon]
MKVKFILFLNLIFFLNVFSKNINLLISPASFNKDNTIKICKGYVNDIIIYLQASDKIKSKNTIHQIMLTINVPENCKLIDCGGVFEVVEVKEEFKEENFTKRKIYRILLKVENQDFCGVPGERPISEWLNNSFFFYFPEDIKDKDYIKFTLTLEDEEETFLFPLESFKIPIVGNDLTFRIGLWSYNIARIKNKECANEFAKFLQNVGINYVQSTNLVLHPIFKERNITSGGYVHHGWFYDSECIDYFPDGKGREDYACPYCASEKYKNNPNEIKGVEKLIETAKIYDKNCIIDYEPIGFVSGFCDKSVNEFMKRFKVKKEEMELFRRKLNDPYPVEDFLKKEKNVREIWYKWYKWYSENVKEYIKLIYEGFKKELKDGKFGITCHGECGEDNEVSIAYCCDQGVMLPYVDEIYPQIYRGYDGVGVKMFINSVKDWKESILKNRLKTKLYPLILIRYAGATVFNEPERISQQIVGALSEGADGVIFYFPGNMDASYWFELSKIVKLLKKYEKFYKNGKRLDNEKYFEIEKMPKSKTERSVWPGVKKHVEDFDYYFSVFALGNKILITMMNLRDKDDIVFYTKKSIETDYKISEIINAEKYENGYIVAPKTISFIVFEKQN